MEEELIELRWIVPQRDSDLLSREQNIGEFSQDEIFNRVTLICGLNETSDQLRVRINVNQISRDEMILLNRRYDIYYQPPQGINLSNNLEVVIPYFRDTILQFNNLYNRIVVNYEIEDISNLTNEQLISRIEIMDFTNQQT